MLENPHIFLAKTGSYLAPGVQTLSDRRKAHQKWCAFSVCVTEKGVCKKQKFCRWLAVLLSAVMLLWTGLPVSAAENTFVHTGSPSQDILAAAESQLGYTAPADGA